VLAHFLRMALKALLRFKLHSAINFLSLGFGFICFVTAVLLANYMDSYDQQWPNANRIYNVVIRNVGEGTGPDKFPIVNDPAARYLRSYFPDIPNIVKCMYLCMCVWVIVSGGGDYVWSGDRWQSACKATVQIC